MGSGSRLLEGRRRVRIGLRVRLRVRARPSSPSVRFAGVPSRVLKVRTEAMLSRGRAGEGGGVGERGGGAAGDLRSDPATEAKLHAWAAAKRSRHL